MTTSPRKATTRPNRVTKPPVGTPSDYQQPTSAKGWKKAGAVLTLPSGNVVRLDNPGIMGLAHKGVVPNGLMATIMDSVQKGTEPTADKLMENVDITEMFDMMANAICAMAVEPEIHPVPAEGEERNPEWLYISEVSEEDQMFIWQWATGGTDDVEQFRRESAGSMVTLLGQSPVAVPTKRSAARRR